MEKFMSLETDSSDDEVFCGVNIGTREILRQVQLGRHTISVVTESDESNESSVELIEAQSEPEFTVETPSPEKPLVFRRSLSQPDLRSSFAPLTWESKVTDESFVAMEALVSAVDTSGASDELDTTLDRIEKILKLGSNQEKNVTMRKPDNSPFKDNNIKDSGNSLKPAPKTPLFKTPMKPHKLKVPWSGGKLTPCQSPMRGPSPFPNISSPVGFYIKHSPQVPLIQTVRPKRPLPHMSAIPKLMDVPGKSYHKENLPTNLPPKAYACAKQSRVIKTPDTKQLPKNDQVKKMASALPHPTVMRHVRREKMPASRPALAPKQEESFAKLSLTEADLSVCEVKSVHLTNTLKRK